MSEHLNQAIADKFAHHSNAELIRRLNEGEPFQTDDEEYELTRRLGEIGMAWMYDERDRVKVYHAGEAS